jgi:hypothetical protein
MYVTWKKPKAGTELYHTPVHIGCAAANGETEKDNIFEKIWKKFEGTDICINKVKIDGGAVGDDAAGKLYYYGIDATSPGWSGNPVPPGEPGNTYSVARDKQTATTKDLLIYRDGRCGAWQKFYSHIINVHGIECVFFDILTDLTLKEVPHKSYHYYRWEILYAGATKGKHHSKIPLEKSWHDHAVLAFGDNLYDTSYGDNYGKMSIGNTEQFREVARKFKNYYKVEYEDKKRGVPPPDMQETGVNIWVDGSTAESNWIVIVLHTL